MKTESDVHIFWLTQLEQKKTWLLKVIESLTSEEQISYNFNTGYTKSKNFLFNLWEMLTLSHIFLRDLKFWPKLQKIVQLELQKMKFLNLLSNLLWIFSEIN